MSARIGVKAAEFNRGRSSKSGEAISQNIGPVVFERFENDTASRIAADGSSQKIRSRLMRDIPRNTLTVAQENLTSSLSAIRDTDLSAEIVLLTKSQILSKSGVVRALAQAGQSPQAILTLLQ